MREADDDFRYRKTHFAAHRKHVGFANVSAGGILYILVHVLYTIYIYIYIYKQTYKNGISCNHVANRVSRSVGRLRALDKSHII